MYSKFLVLLVFSFYFSFCQGQEKVGLIHDPQNGVYAIFSNPAHSALYNYDWHINALGGHLFAETDYASVSNTSAFDLISNYNGVDIAGKPTDIRENAGTRQLIFDRDGGRKTGVAITSLLLPAGIRKTSSTETIGAFARINAAGAFYDLPESLGYYEASAIRQNPTRIDLFSASYMVWTDLGIHYAKSLHKDKYKTTAVGINARLILPHEAGRFELQNEAIYNRVDTLFTAEDLATSSQYTVFNNNSQGIRINGVGLAFDLGFHERRENYSYGLSLLDIGFAFYARNTQTYNIVNDNTTVYNSSNIIDDEDIIAILEDVDFQLDTQISQVVEQGGSFLMGLPTALSFQYHQYFSEHWSFGAVLTQRIPIFNNSVNRPNSISILPRYSSGHWRLSLPISLFEYRDMRVGAAVHYRYFVMGSDDIMSLVGSNNFSGTDIYFGVQFYPFNQNIYKKRVECYKF